MNSTKSPKLLKGIPVELRDKGIVFSNRFALNIEHLLREAYNQGIQDERDRIHFILSNERKGLNAARGGRPCNKPYLQETNQKIEFLDLVLEMLGFEVKVDYRVKNDEQ